MVNLTSKKQYLQTYLSLIKKANSQDINDIYKYIADSKVKDTTKLSYLNSVISLKKIDDKLVNGDLKDIKELRDKLGTKIVNGRENNNITEKQQDAMKKVSLKDLHSFIEELKKNRHNSLKALEDYILIALMVNYPLRNDLQEIALTKYKNDTRAQLNILYIPKKGECILYLKEYKTRHAKDASDIVININEEISDAIRDLVKHDTHRRYLFINNQGEPLSSSSFTHRLNRIFNNKFGVPISSTLIRKIYVTGKYADVKEEMEKDSKMMGHSVGTQQTIYNNNNKINDIKK